MEMLLIISAAILLIVQIKLWCNDVKQERILDEIIKNQEKIVGRSNYE